MRYVVIWGAVTKDEFKEFIIPYDQGLLQNFAEKYAFNVFLVGMKRHLRLDLKGTEVQLLGIKDEDLILEYMTSPALDFTERSKNQ